MIHFRYHHTNCYFLPGSGGRLLAFDAGWPCSLAEYMRGLKSAGHRFDRIAWACVSHFHIDHAGLIADFIRHGIECIAFAHQLAAIDGMERMILKSCPRYERIDPDRLTVLDIDRSRDCFRRIGIAAEALATDAHSADSISLVTDEGEACIGDLYPIDQIMPDDRASLRSWDVLKSRGVKIAYAGHADPIVL